MPNLLPPGRGAKSCN